jgi:hypothetical protein
MATPLFDDMLRWCEQVRRKTPKPARCFVARNDLAWIRGGDPQLVVVRITPRSTVVFEYSAKRTSTNLLVEQRVRVGAVRWSELPQQSALSLTTGLIREACDSRLATFVTCKDCGENVPPEFVGRPGFCLDCCDLELDDE